MSRRTIGFSINGPTNPLLYQSVRVKPTSVFLQSRRCNFTTGKRCELYWKSKLQSAGNSCAYYWYPKEATCRESRKTVRLSWMQIFV